MAVIKADELASVASGYGHLPIARQLGMLVGLAAAVALGVAVILWSQEPEYQPLLSNAAQHDIGEISGALQKSSIPFHIDEKTGALMVPREKVYNARVALASEGVGHASSSLDKLAKNQKFGTSQFMERARYVHALEKELSRTISEFSNIKKARVHLAVPRRSSFLRDHERASASVFLELYAGQRLDRGQVGSIVHLVASSIPGLDSKKVTVVDEEGRLLSNDSQDDHLAISARQFKQTQSIEQWYGKKIEDLLTPLMGQGKVKAKVSAEVDYTHNESTHESFDPESTILRSEQQLTENRGAGAPGGVAGAAANTEGNVAVAANAGRNASRSQSTKNFELNRTIAHTRKQSGKLRRLSVAVLLDDHTKTSATGQVIRRSLSEEEIEKVTQLVKETIGFDARRGDRVSVINSPFTLPPPIEEIPELKLWEKPVFWTLLKQSLGGVFVLFILFGVVKPMLRNLSSRAIEVKDVLQEHEQAVLAGQVGADGKPVQAGDLMDYEDQMKEIKRMAAEDPKRVAQVVKRWMDSD